MKKMTLALLLASSMTSGAAFANTHTLSAGYAQSYVEGFKHIRGFNLQYRYENFSPLSVLASFSWMKGDETDHYRYSGNQMKETIEARYISLLSGPAYRINEYISLYALGGVAHSKADVNASLTSREGNYSLHASDSAKAYSFAYGAGVIINPVENLSVNIGYEGTQAGQDIDSAIDGFILGVGYSF